MSSPLSQLTLGLRALAINIAIFVALATALAWYLGGSLFPGRQTVNFPSFEWMGDDYHFRVIGHGTTPEPVRWELLHTLPDGDEERLTLGIDGRWRSIWGPLVHDGGVLIGLEVETRDGATQWWVAQIDRDRAVTTREVEDRDMMIGTLRGAPQFGVRQPTPGEAEQAVPATP
ncbi:MAG: hypothetical protein FJ254_01655 [Phycisphaerae bacterium]|nr:hypothetical protein [Phycisphaerae bacterium]